jgi:N-terminal half of MaoC dehydratase
MAPWTGTGRGRDPAMSGRGPAMRGGPDFMALRWFPVEAGHVLMFSRALGMADPPPAGPDHATGLPAPGDPVPPTFAIASSQFDPDNHLRPRPGQRWHGSGGGAGQVKEGTGGLHAEQHFTYHRPIRVGDALSWHTRAGETWEKQGRSGHLRFREQITEFRDEAGQLVVTARSVSVQREAS